MYGIQNVQGSQRWLIAWRSIFPLNFISKHLWPLLKWFAIYLLYQHMRADEQWDGLWSMMSAIRYDGESKSDRRLSILIFSQKVWNFGRKKNRFKFVFHNNHHSSSSGIPRNFSSPQPKDIGQFGQFSSNGLLHNKTIWIQDEQWAGNCYCHQQPFNVNITHWHCPNRINMLFIYDLCSTPTDRKQINKLILKLQPATDGWRLTVDGWGHAQYDLSPSKRKENRNQKCSLLLSIDEIESFPNAIYHQRTMKCPINSCDTSIGVRDWIAINGRPITWIAAIFLRVRLQVG